MMASDTLAKMKIVFWRGIGWFFLVVFALSSIASFFSGDFLMGLIFLLVAFSGGLLTGYKRKKKNNTIDTDKKNHWEEENRDGGEEVEYHIEIPKEDEIDIEAGHPIQAQATKKESTQDMVRAALDIRSEVQAGKRTAGIFRRQNAPYVPLLQLCSEIENDTENNYIPFDLPISVEIKYRDRDGEITNRRIDIIYIAASDYSDDYYIKAFCHLRNENRTFNIERIQKTIVNGNSVDIIQHIVNTYRNTDKYKQTILEIKTRELLNSRDTIGYAAKILTYIARIDGIFTRKEKVTIANFIKELDGNKHEIEIEDYVEGLAELKPSTTEYKNIVKAADISEQLIEKAKEIIGKDPLRQGAFEILFKQYEKKQIKLASTHPAP
jgi:hypothetical protein